MSDRIDRWETIDTREIADCRVFKVREDVSRRNSDGAESTFYLTENPDWVNVVSITADRMVILIEQFRHGVKSEVLEIPGGLVDEDEDKRSAALRELVEETGYTTTRMIETGRSHPNPAIQNNTIHHFLALDCERTSEVAFDDHESIVTRLVPLSELDDLVHNGKITHALAVTAIYYAQRYLRNEGLIN